MTIDTDIGWQGHCVELWPYEVDVHKGGGRLVKVDMGRGVNTCQNFVDIFYGWTFGPFCVYLFTSQACKMNEEDAIDRCKWKKMIKDVRWSGWVWVGECFFWYRFTRVVPNQRPLNGCVCVCVRACARARACVCVRVRVCLPVYTFSDAEGCD